MSWHNLPGALVVYDGRGRVTEANEAATTLLGMTRDSLVGSYAQDAEWLVLEAPEGPISVHPVTASLKTAEAVVAMGLSHSKVAYPMPRKLV